MVLRRVLPLVTAAISVFAFQLSHAQPVRSCPDGQAVNSLHPNGTPVTCIPVPPRTNLGPVEAAILQESVERKAADADIRANMSTNETSIVGRYAFTGSQSCLNATRGFNPDFTPVNPPLFVPPPPPPPGTPPQPVVVPTSVVFHSTATVNGIRTFNADGTGTSEFNTVTLTYPNIVYANINGLIQANVSNGAPVGTSVAQAGTFGWQIVDGKLIIDDTNVNGVITAGGSRVGWTTTQRDLPNQTGFLGKDLKVIALTSEGPSVEVNVQTSPAGQAPQVIETPRICQRHRVLTKISP
jgi:hypothetical protein